ncbi:MAG: GNAT family N-acetyltransferase [Rhodothermales bacterium]|nr:GNAT family N-acetyltransferase [Rhodothermales bacterium]
MNWIIRAADAADASDLSELAERTFRATFSEHNTAENMDDHCEAAFSPAVQAAEIADREKLTLVAESGARLVGFAQLHLGAKPPACVTASPSVELHRIYVDQGFHGTGVAGDLMERVIEDATRFGARAVWLGVWEHNPRAIRFYEKFGFTELGDHPFIVGTDSQRDLIMVRALAGLSRGV